MKALTFSFYLLLFHFSFEAFAQPVFKNPNLPDKESYEISDYIDKANGYVITKVNISVKERNGLKYYYIYATEGSNFSNEIELNYDNLTTISEKRVDQKTNSIVEYYSNNGNNNVHFYNKEKGIDKDFFTLEKNIYSRYAYFFSLSGFPFETIKSVSFDTYMAEYGNALTMRATNTGKQTITVKAGTFECYKLELSVAGWISIFAPDVYYIYFSVDSPHHFIKYEEKEDNGLWSSDELIRIINN